MSRWDLYENWHQDGPHDMPRWDMRPDIDGDEALAFAVEMLAQGYVVQKGPVSRAEEFDGHIMFVTDDAEQDPKGHLYRRRPQP